MTNVALSAIANKKAYAGFLLRCYSAVASLTKWLASVKDDLQGEKEREISPATLLAKLLVIAVISGAAFRTSPLLSSVF
jgi:hypothetical protein